MRARAIAAAVTAGAAAGALAAGSTRPPTRPRRALEDLGEAQIRQAPPSSLPSIRLPAPEPGHAPPARPRARPPRSDVVAGARVGPAPSSDRGTLVLAERFLRALVGWSAQRHPAADRRALAATASQALAHTITAARPRPPPDGGLAPVAAVSDIRAYEDAGGASVLAELRDGGGLEEAIVLRIAGAGRGRRVVAFELG